MKQRDRLIAFAAVLAVSACEHGPMPTATPDGAAAGLAAASVSGSFKSFRVPTDNSQPRDIALGSDGNMWLTESEFDVGQIGRVDADGNITEFVVPTRFGQPSDIVAGPDGALWFTQPSGYPGAVIVRVTTDGQFTEFAPECDPNGGCSTVPWGITSGPDGNLWFTESIRNAIVRLTPSGVFTFYPLPTPGAGAGAGITAGPDGALWFTDSQANRIGRIDPATGVITEFGPATGGPSRITAGPDGNLWFTDPFNNKIGRFTPPTPDAPAGVFAEFPLPAPSQPRDIVAGPDGNLWFTEYSAGQLSRITPDGVVTRVQRVRGGPWGIGRGAGNSIWVTQFDLNRVARFTLKQ